MKWIRIIAVSGTAFFSTLGGLLTLQGLTQGAIPINLLLPSSLIVAGIQGALALCRELTDETQERNKMKGLSQFMRKGFNGKTNRILDNLLLW